ncbi:MAG: hypothetical protein PHF17_07765 [Arcobacteraceae bacterium]|nr:hypothetical protein [Arcobacteraceae bacterium]
MSIIGKCPYCKDGNIKVEKKLVKGKNTKVYTCTNASWKSEDGEMYELSKEATCSFRIWGNSLLKWGKKGIGPYEVKKLLEGKNVATRLFSYTYKKEYFKYIILDKEYGVSVLWDLEVEEELSLAG